MTPIHRAQIDHPMAWRGAELTKDDIAFDLTSRHASALEDVLLRLRESRLARGDIQHCRHPALDRDFARSSTRYSKAAASSSCAASRWPGIRLRRSARFFWAIGTHFGRGVSQSARGDLLGLVSDETLAGRARKRAATPAGASYPCMSIWRRSSG